MQTRLSVVGTSALSRNFLALLALVVGAGAAPAQVRAEDPVGPSLDHVPGELLVKFAPAASPATIVGTAALFEATELAYFANLGVRHWRLAPGIPVERALAVLELPAFRGAIEFAEPNYLCHASNVPNDPRRGDLSAMHNLGQTGGTPDADVDALEAWQVQTGSSSIVVGVVDSGIDYNHEDLAANIWSNAGEIAGNGIDDDGNGYVDDVRGWDCVNNDNDPMDDLGHGTHVAGTIGAVGNNGIGVTGMAWNVRLMPLKFINASGSGPISDAIEAINYAASFVDAGGKIVRITNHSWITSNKSKSLESAIKACGALVVAAAGNNGNTTKVYPAGYTLDNIVSVAATDQNDGLASFSNRGSDWVDLGAPGVEILSTTVNSTYGLNGGTSMAAPHVAGTAALVMAQFPGISVLSTKSQILTTVDSVPSLAGQTVTGGRLNARRAVNASELPPDAVAPAAVADLAVASVTEHSATLTWTAPGDDAATGSGYLYDVRYSTTGPVTDANWSTATPAKGEPAPGAAGSGESFILEGLLPDQTYYFAVRTMDEVGNASAASNSASGTTDSNGWIIDVPESADGFFTSHAYDALGRPALAYTNGSPAFTHFAVLDGSTWKIENVDDPVIGSGTFSGLSLGFAADGTPTISSANFSLRAREKVGTTWVSTTIEPADAANSQTWLAFHGTRASISYRYAGGTRPALKLATRNGNYGTSWTTEVVDSNADARFNALAFDGSGNPVIAYSHDQNRDGSHDRLKVARWTGSSWNIQTVDSGVEGYGRYLSLAIDPRTGEPSVAHEGAGQIRFWRYDGSAWNLELPDDDPNFSTMTGLAYGSDGTCWLSYLSPFDVGMKVARRDPATGTWTVDLVDPGHNVSASLSAMRVDPSGLPSLGYSAKLARKPAP